MMKILKSLGLAVAVSAASLSANAATLVFDFSGTLSVAFDPAQNTPAVISEYTAEFNALPKYKTFSGQLVLPSFENYLSGVHTIGFNTAGLQLSLVSGLFGGLEGTKANVPSRFKPDSTQEGTGFLTIANGTVAGLSWAADASNPLVERYNSRVPEQFGWPTRLGDISVSLSGSSTSYSIGDVYFAANTSGMAAATMVPEADSYAMLLAGLGVVGAIVRRRRKAK